MSKSRGLSSRGWRFFAAQVIYWVGIGLLGLVAGAMLGVLIWITVSNLPPKALAVIGIVLAISLVVFGYGTLFTWAEKYLKENK